MWGYFLLSPFGYRYICRLPPGFCCNASYPTVSNPPEIDVSVRSSLIDKKTLGTTRILLNVHGSRHLEPSPRITKRNKPAHSANSKPPLGSGNK